MSGIAYSIAVLENKRAAWSTRAPAAMLPRRHLGCQGVRLAKATEVSTFLSPSLFHVAFSPAKAMSRSRTFPGSRISNMSKIQPFSSTWQVHLLHFSWSCPTCLLPTHPAAKAPLSNPLFTASLAAGPLIPHRRAFPLPIRPFTLYCSTASLPDSRKCELSLRLPLP